MVIVSLNITVLGNQVPCKILAAILHELKNYISDKFFLRAEILLLGASFICDSTALVSFIVLNKLKCLLVCVLVVKFHEMKRESI